MLLRFSVSNHRSFCEEQTISLVASSLKDSEEGLIDTTAINGLRFLPAIVLYGANASGKSNLIAAVRFMKNAVQFSHSRSGPEDRIDRRPFVLDQKNKDQPTILEMDFIFDGVPYEYGFECDDHAFTKEWLYSSPVSRKRLLFEREGAKYEFGRSLQGQNRVISRLARPNSLFVSTAAQNDHAELSKISKYITDILINRSVMVNSHQILSALKERDIDARVISFLKGVGTGVIDYTREKIAISEEALRFSRSLGDFLKKELDEDVFQFDESDSVDQIKLGHMTSAGAPVYFDLDWESAGTRRLIILLDQVFRVLDSGGTLFLDELDVSLHTYACEALLALFCLKSTNPKGAQLIATTHNTNLLQSKYLRRDQVWFVEKSAGGGTELFPLTDISTRKGDNIEAGYLQGRFGAVPLNQDLSEIIRPEK